MKNIHVLPTDKPSRLFEIIQFNLSFDSQNMYSEEYKKLHKYKNQNIYITSDEEIKEGDWYLDTFNTQRIKANEFSDHKHYVNACKKIILTTDQDLIKDDVRAINDTFLEWFVKNPSCESVEVDSWSDDLDGYWLKKYKIIIPSKEPQQETLEEAVKRICSNQDINYSGISVTEWMQKQNKNMYSEEEFLEFSEWVSHNDWVYLPSKGYWVNEEVEESEEKFTTKELFKQFKNK
jgi:hypothetical protein